MSLRKEVQYSSVSELRWVFDELEIRAALRAYVMSQGPGMTPPKGADPYKLEVDYLYGDEHGELIGAKVTWRKETPADPPSEARQP